MSRDPIGEDGGENLYTFLNNSSVAAIDLLGLDQGCPEGQCCVSNRCVDCTLQNLHYNDVFHDSNVASDLNSSPEPVDSSERIAYFPSTHIVLDGVASFDGPIGPSTQLGTLIANTLRNGNIWAMNALKQAYPASPIVARAWARCNKLNHIFGNPNHRLVASLKLFNRGQNRAYRAVQAAVQGMANVGKLKPGQAFHKGLEIVVSGHRLRVTGYVSPGGRAVISNIMTQ